MRPNGRRPTRPSVQRNDLRWERDNCWIRRGFPVTQSMAASLTGVTATTWSAWETGNRGMSAKWLARWRTASEPYRAFRITEAGAYELLPHDHPRMLELFPPVAREHGINQGALDALTTATFGRHPLEPPPALGQPTSGTLVIPDAEELERQALIDR